MKYDFETLVDRRSQGSVKWMEMYQKNPNVGSEVVPMSVADMEFKNAPEVLEGLKLYLDQTILGYSGPTKEFYESVLSWMKRRHNFEVKSEWMVHTAGIVPAFFNAIRVFSSEGDGVITMPPVYFPFYDAIELQSRKIEKCPLIENEGYYTIDYDLLEKLAAKPDNKILLFCSPHNPVGRVWKKGELERVADIVLKYDLILLSDEIHNDLIMPGYEHTVFQTLSDELADRTVTFTAPSKTFNLAGLSVSNTIIKNNVLRDKFAQGLKAISGGIHSGLAFKASEIAYNNCEAWLDECITIIDKNQRLVHEFFSENFPDIRANLIEGTYLQWVDFRALGLSGRELENFMVDKAQLFLDEGYIFGEAGEGYERFNLAIPSDILKKALKRLELAMKKL